MAFKKFLGKIPSSLKKEPNFPVLLDFIKSNNIHTIEHLFKFLEQNLVIVEKWLKDNKNSGTAMAESIREKVTELQVLKKCHSLARRYLI